MTILPNLEAMRMQIDTLFDSNDKGDLIATNNLERHDAPLLFLGRTSSGNIWRFHESLDNDTRNKLERLLMREAPFSPRSPDTPPRHQAEILKTLDLNANDHRLWSGPAYYCSACPDQETGKVVQVTPFNKDILEGDLAPWREDAAAGLPLFASLEDGKPVAVCGSVRLGDAAHEAGVETSEHHRRKGHGLRATTAWARHIWQMGLTPLYSTDWENAASQAVARALGLTLIGSDFHIRKGAS